MNDLESLLADIWITNTDHNVIFNLLPDL